MSEDDLNKEKIRERIADSLVDDLGQGEEVLDRVRLVGARRLSALEGLESLLREENSAVAVGLKVYSNVVAESSVVEVLDTGGGAGDGDVALRLGDVKEKMSHTCLMNFVDEPLAYAV